MRALADPMRERRIQIVRVPREPGGQCLRETVRLRDIELLPDLLANLDRRPEHRIVFIDVAIGRWEGRVMHPATLFFEMLLQVHEHRFHAVDNVRFPAGAQPGDAVHELPMPLVHGREAEQEVIGPDKLRGLRKDLHWLRSFRVGGTSEDWRNKSMSRFTVGNSIRLSVLAASESSPRADSAMIHMWRRCSRLS